MQQHFEQHSSLRQSQMWLGLSSLRSERCDDYRPFEPTTALCGGKPGI
jgi:hypothetical protein